MKIKLSIVILSLFALFGCTKSNDVTFQGYVIAVESQRVFVRGAENPDIYYAVPFTELVEYACENVEVSDRLEITYDGIVLESDPPQFQAISDIEIINDR